MSVSQVPLDYARANLAILSGEDPGFILWQPRLEFWYAVNRKRGTLPAHLKDCTLIDVYDHCHASIRYFTRPLKMRYRTVETIEARPDEKHLRRTFRTPVGNLTEMLGYDEWGLSCHHVEYRLKTAEDFGIYEYMLGDEEWYWDQEAYDREVAAVGRRGIPQFYFRRSPVQGLYIENMGFENTVLFSWDHPDVIDRFIAAATAADDAMYDLLRKAPVQVLNFGENIDAFMDPPPTWRKLLMPYWEKRVAQLRAAGKATHIHIDGTMKPLLRLIRDSPFDGIEACTPVPQGDVTLEEIKAAIGDKVLLDGIPAILFLPMYPVEQLVTCTRRLVELFYPRLILGISDELPPDADIERVRMVGALVQDLV